MLKSAAFTQWQQYIFKQWLQPYINCFIHLFYKNVFTIPQHFSKISSKWYRKSSHPIPVSFATTKEANRYHHLLALCPQYSFITPLLPQGHSDNKYKEKQNRPPLQIWPTMFLGHPTGEVQYTRANTWSSLSRCTQQNNKRINSHNPEAIPLLLSSVKEEQAY